jgi:N-carbamoylputrescine amidase
MDLYRVALVQMAMAADAAANMSKAAAMVREAARTAQVICLPELYRSRYFCQREDARFFEWAEPIPGPSSQQFAELARELGAVIIVPVFERRAPGLYHNSVVVLDADGRMAGVYRKMHIPDDPGYYEKYYFRPGDLGFRVFDTRVGRIGVLICWDQWFPEAARLVALRGAEVLFYPTAIGWSPGEKGGVGECQREAWIAVQRSHAIANGVYVASVNRVGHEEVDGSEGIEFWGSSFVADPQGALIAQASVAREEITYADVRKVMIENTRRIWPFLRDRRTDAYGDLARTFCDSQVHQEDAKTPEA